MGLLDRFSGVKKQPDFSEEDFKNLEFESADVIAKEHPSWAEDRESKEIEKTAKSISNRKLKEKLAELTLEKKFAIGKAIAVKQAVAQEERKTLLFKQKIAQEKEYGPGTFYIGGKEIPLLGQISQARNWQMAQDLKRARKEADIQFQRNRLQGLSPSGGVPQQQSGGFGNPLSMGGDLGFGMGMSMGPSQQEQSQQFQQPQQQGGMGMGSGFNSELRMPVIAGLGGGFGMFGSQPQEEQQPQFVPQPRVSLPPEYPQYATRPANTLQNVPKAKIVGYVSKSNPNVIQYGTDEQPGSIYRKTMQSYGASYKKISPDEIMEGEKLYKRIRTPYGHKHILIK